MELSYKPPTDPATIHSLRSCNLKFLESVWSVAKTCSGLQVIFRTVYLFDHPSESVQKLRGKDKKQLKRKKTPVQVDIIAQNGLEWIKVANISQKRLETEFAKARWEAEGFRDDECSTYSSDENEENTSKQSKTEEDISKIITDFQNDSDAFSLVKSARSMVKAAQQTRVQYLHPEITIFLPNLAYDAKNPDTSSPTHALVSAILSTGARVQTSTDVINFPTTSDSNSNVDSSNTGGIRVDALGNPLDSLLTHLSLTSDPKSLITPSVILDCTLLLALVSDLSHSDVPESPIFHRYILAQVRAEREEPLLPNWLYPAIVGRDMSCTWDAYKRFREIVEIVGSPEEKRRAEVLVWGGPKDWKHPSTTTTTTSSKKTVNTTGTVTAGGDKYPYPTVLSTQTDEATKASLLTTLQSLSKHAVPDTLRLPIKVIDSLENQLTSHDAVAAKISQELSSVNRSSLFAAWELGWTIVTTNGSVVKRVEWLVEENRMRDEDKGPKVHLIAIARSLVGKMKRSQEILGAS
ncbi:hypothetical protein AA313_de0206180 [Arthrobotrys entomopaga]|nr:hypothetical protein AA313_de0206180 [Arthrobotrys entomopaga]